MKDPASLAYGYVTGVSAIPPTGRALSSEERAALLAEMEDIIATSHLFKSLDPAGREEILGCGYVCGYSLDDVIIKEGLPGTSMFMVLRGNVKVEMSAPSGVVSLCTLGRGACFGEVSVLHDRPRTATVTALEDVDCVAFEKHRIDRILTKYPKVRKVLEAILEGRARDAIEKIVKA